MARHHRSVVTRDAARSFFYVVPFEGFPPVTAGNRPGGSAFGPAEGRQTTLDERTRMIRSIACVALLFAAGCYSDPTAPGGEEVSIRMRVTGGFAGVDYSFTVDGQTGAVVGEACVQLCDFRAGELLVRLSRRQVQELVLQFENGGILGLGRRDFGTQCCDQFHFEIDYRNGNRAALLTGSSEVMPPALGPAIATMMSLARKTLPAVVDFQTRPDSWPRDPVVALRDVTVDGGVLTIAVSHGGGCADHTFDAVAWGGWKESNPVQVDLFLSHDAKGDLCEALVFRDLRFDLTPLRRAYVRDYAPAGPTTIRIRIADPVTPGAGVVREVHYVF